MSSRTLVTLALLLLVPSCTDDDPIANQIGELQGRWVSADCEDVGGGFYLIRRFTIAGTSWSDDGTVYHDAACATAAFDFSNAGELAVLGESQVVPGAFESDFGESTKTLTMRDPAIVGFLNSQPAGTCGAAPWAVDQTQDITTTGCQTFGQQPITTCPREYDLTEVSADSLYLGDRTPPNDLCTARPQQLTAAPVVRVM